LLPFEGIGKIEIWPGVSRKPGISSRVAEIE
jgi:hypothetical protein